MTKYPSVLDFLSNVNDLPLILAGPMLRRTESDAVTVWLALTESCGVTLKIYCTQQGQGSILSQSIAEGQSNTIQLGQKLHLVAITATPIGKNCLEAGHIYAYNLFFDLNQENLATLFQSQEISYFEHQLPTFCLPSDHLANLRIVHGSCRKPHGGERDALPCLDDLIQESAAEAKTRPQQLFLTGDQIYGDDVADPFLWVIQGISNLLLGWEEELPLSHNPIAPSQLRPGQRSEIARLEGGFTAMLRHKSEKAKSHLFSFGEYAAAYLLTWSPVLIPIDFPRGKNLFRRRKLARHWDREVRAVKSFMAELGIVRRVLANIPTYTICDDHDISDDWYLNRFWCDRVLSKPFGRRVVQNGLLAYALFQAWGNTPEQFQTGKSGEKLLQAVVQWSSSQGSDSAADKTIARYLGMPLIDPETGLPKLQLDRNVLVLQRDRQALAWHYQIKGCQHEVIVLDTRTWRGYPAEDRRGIEPPMLLCPTAFTHQLHQPLDLTDSWNRSNHSQIELTFVVIPTNLVTLKVIDKIQQWELTRNRVFSSDVGDSWNFHQEALAKLLLTFAQKRDRVIILSGDIHYSCAIRLSSWFSSSSKTSVLVQLTSSAIKNSEWTTRLIHTKLKYLLRESPEHWLGWQESLQLRKIPQINWWKRLCFWQPATRSLQPATPPDWQYLLEWIKRQPFELVSGQPRVSQSSNWQQIIKRWFFWLWRNRWLQEGVEVVGRNNLSLVKLQWSEEKQSQAVIQETHWHPPWNSNLTVKSCYSIALMPKILPSLLAKSKS